MTQDIKPEKNNTFLIHILLRRDLKVDYYCDHNIIVVVILA